MRISFDVDDTLVLHGLKVPAERGRLPAFLHHWFSEPLRHRTRSLFRQLRRRGCSIWIYTSSGRTIPGIRFWLFLHGIRVDGIVNDERHRRTLAGRNFERLPSKYPPAFDIDLHVDDSEGVRMEGEMHNFKVLVVHPEDLGWSGKVLNAVDEVLGPGQLASSAGMT